MTINKKAIRSYQKNFKDSFNVPPMLDDIKAELTFTPHIILKKRVKLRFLVEILTSFVLIYMAYMDTRNVDMDLEGPDLSQPYLMLAIAGVSFLLFLIDISHKSIKIRKRTHNK